MTREEDLVRSTTSAIAATIRDVPPLGLRSGPEVLIVGSGEPGHRPGSRRRVSRLVPVGAAAMVAAAAIGLVALSASVPHGDGARRGSTVPAGAAVSAARVPEYYVAVTPTGRLVAGNTETGKTVAGIDAPPGLVFDAVTAASDDRTFLASAAPAPPSRGAIGCMPIGVGADLGGYLYLVRLTPGTGQLTLLASIPRAGVLAAALSASGQELAVASATGTSSAVPAYSVSVYSAPAGRPLHAWTTATDVFGKNSHLQALTWVDDDKGIMFATNTAAGDPGVTAGDGPAAGRHGRRERPRGRQPCRLVHDARLRIPADQRRRQHHRVRVGHRRVPVQFHDDGDVAGVPGHGPDELAHALQGVHAIPRAPAGPVGGNNALG